MPRRLPHRNTNGNDEFAPLRVRILDDATFGRMLAHFDDRDHQLADPYLDAITALHHEELRKVAVELGGEVVALAAVRIRRLPMLGGIALVAGGPVVANGAGGDRARLHQLAVQAMSSAFAEEGIRLHFRSTVLPTVEGWMPGPTPGLGASPVFDQYHTMVIDLAADQDLRRTQISPQWRRHLRTAERAELDIDQPPIADAWQRMRPLYLEMQERKHFDTALPTEFWDDVFDKPAADEHFRGVVVRRKGRDLAAAITGGNASVVTYLLGATSHVALPVRAGYLAMWATVGLARKFGHRFLDLGGVDQQANPGGWQFKHGLRGDEISTPVPVASTVPVHADNSSNWPSGRPSDCVAAARTAIETGRPGSQARHAGPAPTRRTPRPGCR